MFVVVDVVVDADQVASVNIGRNDRQKREKKINLDALAMVYQLLFCS